MKLKLNHKLFGAFFGLSVLAVILMTSVIVLSTYRVFGEHAAEMKLEELTPLVDALAQRQRAQGDLAFYDSGVWERFVHVHLDRNVEHSLPPMEGPPRGKAPPPRPAPSHRGIPVFPVLFDAAMVPVAGPYQRDIEYVKRSIDVEGRTVGWVGLEVIRNPSFGLNRSYLTKQTRAVYLAGGMALLVSLLAAFLFARWLSRPIRDLTQATQALGEGRRDIVFRATSGDELGTLMRNFTDMAKTIGDNERQKTEWLSNIAHELRTPLTVLRGTTEALQDGLRKPDVATLETLHSEVIRLGRLVDDIHHLSLADQKAIRYHFVSMDPVGLLKKVVSEYQERYAAANLSLTLEAQGEASISGDPIRLEQLFSNLLENTIHYTHEGGGLRIHAAVDGAVMVVHFEDTAPGVAENELDRIFERLYRVDRARSRSTGGSGLGLSICRTIVAAHGGTINAATAAAGGLDVSVTLPAGTGEAQ